MSLTAQSWQEKAKTKLQQIQQWLHRGDAPHLVYGTVAGLALWPVIEAAAAAPPGQLPGAIYLALGSLAGSIGSNLIAEQLQRWRDRAEPVTESEVAAWIAQETSHNAELRQAVDTLLTSVSAVPQAQAAISETDRAWFIEALQQAFSQLGNLPRFEAVLWGDGGIAQGQGSIAVGKQGVYVSGDVGGSIFTGDKNRQVQAAQYIEHYHTADPAQAVEAHALRDTYLRRLLTDTNILGLTGVDPKAASDTQETRLQLNAVYTVLFTHQSEHLGGIAPGFLEGGRAKPASALAQLNQHSRLVLLGEPGGGKSTFVNFVAACMAGELLGLVEMNLQTLTTPLPEEEQQETTETQPWVWGALLPVRVILRDLAARGLPEPGKPATADDLWAFLEVEDKTKNVVPYLRRQLEQTGGLLLLDGLDEVPEAHERREQIRQLVEDLAATLPHTRLVVTSRTYAYQQQAWQLRGFHSAVLAPFTPVQIRYFVDRWYAHIAEVRGLHASDAQGQAERLKQAIFANKRLQALAERPLLLTLMASLHAWRGGSLPEKREKLYDEAVDLLLEKWENQRIARDKMGQMVMQPSLAEMLKVGREKVLGLLHRLAYEAHKNQPDLTGTADIPQTTLVNELVNLRRDPDLKPLRLVEFLSDRAGLLLPHGVEMYTFPHRTFQEYLAACHLANSDRIDELAELAQKDPHRWREVLLLAVARSEGGFTGAVWSFVDSLCPDPCDTTQETEAEAAWGAHLAGLALAETGNLENLSKANRNKVARVQGWLVQGIRQPWLPPLERAKATVSLARLGDPRPEATTVDGMHFCYIPQGPFWMGSDEDNPLEKDAERPLHQLRIPYAYWLGRFPVTNAQFAAFVAEGGYNLAEYWPEAAAQGWWKEGQARGYTWIVEKQEYKEMWRDKPYDYGRPFNLPNHPVVGITWYEMLAFTRWLTRRWQQAGWLPDSWAIQLPSEAEWEKAARGGLQIPIEPIVKTAETFSHPPSVTLQANPFPQRRFPWGEEDPTPEQANYEQTKIGSTSGVGCFPAGGSPYGCEEMAGNVLEWTRSLWGRYDREKSQGGKLVFEPMFRYPYEPGQERENLAADTWWPRVWRGGVWAGDETWLRCAFRIRYPPHDRDYYIGFRLVASPFPVTSDL